jgi:nitroimidazol reductase NimA-like FMN-containing flavoprotein (pyridoxamine 5'-phosphate oxidase superfamily)
MTGMANRIDQVNRHAERARHDQDDLFAVLDAGHHVGSLSTVVEGRPWVVPMLYGRLGSRILLHGSVGAGALRHVAAGAPAALCVTHLDGWVYADTLFDSSANYRSAVVHGELMVLSGDEATEALDAISDGLFPGRRAEVPAYTRKQLAATQALALDIVEGCWTVKIRQGGPGEPADPAAVPPDLWTGVLPITSVYGEPQPAERVSAGVDVSASIQELAAASRKKLTSDIGAEGNSS